jgi:hypothetical protein
VAVINLVTADRARIVESLEQMTLPAGEAITAGQAVRVDTSTGKFTGANGSAAGEARIYGVATKTVAAGLPVTAVRRGVLDGFNLSSLAYDAAVYLSDTDGRLDTAAGTVSTVVGRVIPVFSQLLGDSPQKLLLVNL